MKYNKYGPLAVVITALLWSADAVLRRHLYTLPAPVIVFYEHSLGVLVLLPLVLFGYKNFKRLTGRQWLSITLVAALSGAAGTILYTAALGRIQYIPFSIVVLLQQLNPIFAILTSALLLHEPLTKRFFGLSAVAIAGGYVTVFPHLNINLSTGHGTLVAGLMAVGAAAAWGTSTAFSKYTLDGPSTIQVTALRYGLTIPFAMLFVLGSGSAHALGAITFSQFLYLLAITFSTGLLAVLIYYFGLKRVLASRSAILELTWPASAVFIGWIFLKQGLTATQIIASLVMVGAIYLVAREQAASAQAKSGANVGQKTRA
jgi:drug/metabolite transporter (DMT)-like permease